MDAPQPDARDKGAKPEKPQAAVAPKSNAGSPAPQSAAAGKEKPSQLVALQKFFEDNGKPFEDGWRLDIKHRSGGSSAGTSDVYYYSPAGKRYRSRAEIARDFGMAPERAPKGSGTGSRARQHAPTLLSREAAWSKAQMRAAATPLPHRLTNGGLVTNLGKVPADPAGFVLPTALALPGFTSHWTDDKGVRFTSTILQTPAGPRYAVRVSREVAAPAADGARPSAAAAKAEELEVEIAAAVSPDAVWAAVAERQAEAAEAVLLSTRDGQSDEDEAVRDAADTLLLQAAPLEGVRGLERFGLADVLVLQALEGQEGVEGSPYQFVEQRTSWDEEVRRLANEALQMNKSAGGQDSGKGDKPARGRPRTQAERDAVTVSKLMESMLRQLETGQARSAAAEDKARQKQERDLQRALEKEQRRLAKEREREITRQLQEQQREQQRELWREQQRRAAEAAMTLDDETLPGAELPPPEPRPLAGGRLPPSCEPPLLEAWHLAHRFAGELGMDPSQLPSLPALEAAVAQGPGARPDPASPDAATLLTCALTSFLVGDLYNQTAATIGAASEDVREADLRPKQRGSFPLVVQAHTWQEAARRYLTILSTAAMVGAREGRGGLPQPLAAMDAFLVLQYLTAGPPEQLNTGVASLPAGPAPHAWHGILARSDAQALTQARRLGGAPAPAPEGDTSVRLMRAILQQLTTIKASGGVKGRVLCFEGLGAAAAAKHARPLDLQCVAARVDAGLYACYSDPLAAFAADVESVCTLHHTAAGKQATGFGQEAAEQGTLEAATLAASTLQAALAEVGHGGVQAYLDLHAPHTTPEGGADPAKEAVHDLGRPFAPWPGCAVCWSQEDGEQLVQCERCGCACHCYCLSPGLEHPPPGPWECGRCAAQGSMQVDGGASAPATPEQAVEFARCSGGAGLWAQAQLLGGREWAEWSPEQRAELLGTLAALVADSPALHEVLTAEEERQREVRKTLMARRAEYKQLQQEEAAAAQAQKAAEGGQQAPDAAGGEEAPARPASARRGRDPAAAQESLVAKISKLEHDLTLFGPHRLEPLGFDRHWNRYWLLPGAALGKAGDQPDAVLVERRLPDAGLKLPGAGAAAAPALAAAPLSGDRARQVGVYRDAVDLDGLLGWLNAKGTREKALGVEVRKVRHQVVQQQHMQQLREGGAGPVAMEEDVGAVPEDAAEVQAPLERLRQALLDLQGGWKRDMWHPVAGTSEELAAWQDHVAGASTPAALMAGLITLEAALSPERLKPHWRPWAWPAPFPAHSHTLASVWLRLEALKTAVSLKVLLNIGGKALGLGAGLGGRYPARDQAKQGEAGPKGGKKRGPSGADNAGNSSGGEGSRAVRAAKRSRPNAGSGDDSPDADEAMARRLQSQLNSGVRSTRSRLRDVFTAHGGERGGQGARYALREGASQRAYQDGSGSEDQWEGEEEYVEEEEDVEEEAAEEEKASEADSEEEYSAEGDSGED